MHSGIYSAWPLLLLSARTYKEENVASASGERRAVVSWQMRREDWKLDFRLQAYPIRKATQKFFAFWRHYGAAYHSGWWRASLIQYRRKHNKTSCCSLWVHNLVADFWSCCCFLILFFPQTEEKKKQHGATTRWISFPASAAGTKSFRLLAFNSHLTSWRWQLKTRLLSTTWVLTSILGTSEWEHACAKILGSLPSLPEDVLAFKPSWKSNQTHLKVKSQRISAITPSAQKTTFYSEHSCPDTPRQF